MGWSAGVSGAGLGLVNSLLVTDSIVEELIPTLLIIVDASFTWIGSASIFAVNIVVFFYDVLARYTF